jgi:dynein heavy chain
MTNIIEILLKSANLCAKELEMNDMARLFKTDIEAFKGIHSVLTSLRDPALREKEWDSIRVLIN